MVTSMECELPGEQVLQKPGHRMTGCCFSARARLSLSTFMDDHEPLIAAMNENLPILKNWLFGVDPVPEK